MLKHEEIKECGLILSNFNDYTQRKICLGVIINVRPSPKKDELVFDIYFPETNSTERDICEGSVISADAKSIGKEEAELFQLNRINHNEKQILLLREANINIKNPTFDIFEKELSC